MPQSAHRTEHGRLVCHALRGAHGSPMLAVSDLLLPPNGDESARTPDEATTTIRGSHSCLLVELRGQRILIDGSLDSVIVRAGLHEIGIAEHEIDVVLITHGDTDHIAGLVDTERQLVYAHAAYVLHRSLWEAWTSGGERGDPDPYYEEAQRAVALALSAQIADRVTLIDADSVIAPGVRALNAPGHRPSHIAYEVSDETCSLLDVGDAAIAPVLVEQHGRGNAFDSDPVEGIRSRQRLLERASSPQTLTFIPHFPWPGFVRISKQGDRFRWSPAA